MQEKLIIQNFGPIKHVELDLKKVNVLIGENGTGKSTIAKILSILRDIRYHKRNKIFHDFLFEFKIAKYLTPKTEMYFESKYFSFTYDFTFSEDIKYNSYPNVSLRAEIKNEELIFNLFDKQFFQSNYIPSDRNLITSILENPFNFFNSDVTLSGYLRKFGEKYVDALSILLNEDEIFYFLNNSFTRKDNKIYLRNQDGLLLLNETHSGLQSIFPLFLVFEGENTRQTFHIIEEPEQNLFPILQHDLNKLLISKLEDNSLLLTTHSPYILTSLNNLIQAHITGTKDGNEEKVNDIIDKKYWLDPKDVSAYMLKFDEQEGGVIAENILDEDGLIRAEKIDGVSRILNEEFDRLLDIDFNIEK